MTRKHRGKKLTCCFFDSEKRIFYGQFSQRCEFSWTIWGKPYEVFPLKREHCARHASNELVHAFSCSCPLGYVREHSRSEGCSWLRLEQFLHLALALQTSPRYTHSWKRGSILDWRLTFTELIWLSSVSGMFPFVAGTCCCFAWGSVWSHQCHCSWNTVFTWVRRCERRWKETKKVVKQRCRIVYENAQRLFG